MNDIEAIREKIAHNVQSYRKRFDLTKRGLAAKAGVDEKQIRRLEGSADAFCPTIPTLMKIAKVFGIDYKELLL